MTHTDTSKDTTRAAPPITYSIGTGSRPLLIPVVDCKDGSFGNGNSSSTMPVPKTQKARSVYAILHQLKINQVLNLRTGKEKKIFITMQEIINLKFKWL